MVIKSIFLVIGLIQMNQGCIPTLFGPQPVAFAPEPAYSYGGGEYVPPAGVYSSPSVGSYGYNNPYSKSRMASDRGTFVAAESSLDTQTFDSTTGCTLDRYADQKLDCAVPFDRRVPISSEAECQQICLENLLALCRSFQYDHAKKNCDLYDVSISPASIQQTSMSSASGQQLLSSDLVPLSALGQNANNVLSPFLGHKSVAVKADQPIEKESNFDDDFKRQKRYLAQNGVPNFSDPKENPPASEQISEGALSRLGRLPFCKPEIKPADNIVFVALNPQCHTANKLPGFAPMPPTPSQQDNFLPPPPPYYPTQSGQYISAARKPDLFKNTQIISDGQNKFQQQLQQTITDCPNGLRAKIQMIDGIGLVEQRPIARIQVQSAETCLKLCRNNANLDGTAFTRPCSAATYDKATSKCEILDDKISPNGELNYIPNAESVYFEKIIPQHTLDSRASGTGAVVTAPSQVDCLRQCIRSQKKLGFECVSASFYFDWHKDNCYLSRFSRLIRPDLYVPERRQLVDYLEVAPCMKLPSWQHDDATLGPTWSSWSDCDQTMIKSRRRNCTNCPTNFETAPCTGPESLRTTATVPIDNPTRTIASTLEAAMQQQQAMQSNKRSKQTTSSERSLFGEQDYSNQADISYFGPPNQMGAESAKTSIKAVKSQNSDDSESCDPYKECCQKPNDLKELVRGCSSGYRIDSGKTVACIPKVCL